MHPAFGALLLTILSACGARSPAPATALAAAERRHAELADAMGRPGVDYPTVRVAGDSLLAALDDFSPSDRDTAYARQHGSLVTRVRALVSRSKMQSGDGISLEEAAALHDADPESPSTLAPGTTVAATPDVVVAARGRRDTVPTQERLLIPVAGLRTSDLHDTYSDARSTGRVHNAIDIMAPRGTPVVAATDGRIVKLFVSERGGITIYQRGTDGRTIYYYAHLDRYADGVVEQSVVRRGAVLGYVGNSGNAGANNYHLHFAIWIVESPDQFWDGTPVNPYPLLLGRL